MTVARRNFPIDGAVWLQVKVAGIPQLLSGSHARLQFVQIPA
ncbi:MAG TPA: hypothetical protein VL198_04480 [Pseudolabrys sp.]|nr:hypothetical protein [Pseudolabrys sp.]